MLKKLLRFALVFFSCLAASRGLIKAILAKKIMVGHDTSAYAIFLTETHDNIAHGNFFPMWAQHLRYGFGEPHLQFRPPLQTYLTELAYLLSGDLFGSIQAVQIFFLLCASIGMYFFLRKLCTILSNEAKNPVEEWIPALGASAYALSPYFLADIYVRGALSEASCFLTFPWLALAFLHLALAPSSRAIGLAALSYAALASSHAAIHLFTLPFLLFAIALFWKRIEKPWLLFAAIALGFAATAFYWMIALGESGLVKTALLAVDFEAYVGHFVRVDQLIFMPWNYDMGAVRFSIGAFGLFGIVSALWVWAHQASLPGQKNPRTFTCLLALLAACAVCAYLMHRSSAGWYEIFPWLQIMSFPWRFLTLLTFFSTVLGSVAALFVLRTHSQIAALGALTFVLGALSASPPGLAEYAAKDFEGEAIAKSGMGWLKPYSTPSTAGVLPTSRAANAVELVHGRAELRCTREGPTQMKCDALAVQPSTIRFNVLDYPRWITSVDGKPATTVNTDPLRGTLSVSIPPGQHALQWELRDTPLRMAAKAASVATWILILALLFQDQLVKAKALLPKRQ